MIVKLGTEETVQHRNIALESAAACSLTCHQREELETQISELVPRNRDVALEIAGFIFNYSTA